MQCGSVTGIFKENSTECNGILVVHSLPRNFGQCSRPERSKIATLVWGYDGGSFIDYIAQATENTQGACARVLRVAIRERRGGNTMNADVLLHNSVPVHSYYEQSLP
jgi:hypothetical protein